MSGRRQRLAQTPTWAAALGAAGQRTACSGLFRLQPARHLGGSDHPVSPVLPAQFLEVVTGADLAEVQTCTASLSTLCGEVWGVDAQSLMERAVVLGHGANTEETSPALAALVNQYASLLAAQVRRLACCTQFSAPASDPASCEHIFFRNLQKPGSCAESPYHRPL